MLKLFVLFGKIGKAHLRVSPFCDSTIIIIILYIHTNIQIFLYFQFMKLTNVTFGRLVQ